MSLGILSQHEIDALLAKAMQFTPEARDYLTVACLAAAIERNPRRRIPAQFSNADEARWVIAQLGDLGQWITPEVRRG